MKKKLHAALNFGLIAPLIIASAGCSAFRSPEQTVSIECHPSDTVLLVNGQRYTSPATLSVKRNREISINCEKDGYYPYDRTVGTHFNTTGVLDAVGTCLFLIPAIGLFTPGAWSLDETNVTVNLVPKQ
jgi:hypothetical protein